MDTLVNVWELVKTLGIAVIGIAAICAAVALFGGLLEKIEGTDKAR